MSRYRRQQTPVLRAARRRTHRSGVLDRVQFLVHVAREVGFGDVRAFGVGLRLSTDAHVSHADRRQVAGRRHDALVGGEGHAVLVVDDDAHACSLRQQRHVLVLLQVQDYSQT